MNYFYIADPGDSEAVMDATESNHCIGVFRHKLNDRIVFTDGKGFFYTGIILEPSRKACRVKITDQEKKALFPPYSLTIAIAPTKSNDRFEWFLEKATEIGVSEIIPLYCQNSERKHIRKDRLEKVLISAMKQSGKAFLPRLRSLQTFSEFMLQDPEKQSYIAHCREEKREYLINQEIQPLPTTVLIGPEGDFSKEEIEQALVKGYLPVSLGDSRLRTETAGVVAAQVFMDIYLSTQK